MKSTDKNNHIITKVVALILGAVATFFAICDFSPSEKEQEIVITHERK